MFNLGIKAPDRATAIEFMVNTGIILKYAAPVYEDVPDQWMVKTPDAPAIFDKAPTASELASLTETIKIPAHTRLKEPELAQFDASVINESGLRDPITRTLKVADDTKKTDAQIDPNFYCLLQCNADGLEDFLGGALNKGGTVNNKFTLSKRGDLSGAVASEVQSRTIGVVTVFVVGGEKGLPAVELNRTFL